MICHKEIAKWNWFSKWSYLFVSGRGPSVSRVSSFKAPEHQPQSSSPNLSPITSPSKVRRPPPIPEESTAEEENSEDEQAEAVEGNSSRPVLQKKETSPTDSDDQDKDNSFFENSTVGKHL